MRQSLDEIAELAEFIAEENLIRGAVSLKRIATKRNIEVHYDYFENYFTGMLQYENKNFDIFINLAKVINEKYSRARFTLAHELGHYCIDDHRNTLKKGLSLSYDKDLHYFSNDPIEREANHFATNLLMPRTRFMQSVAKMEIGIGAVKQISKQFKTSITSTAIQYQNLINYPCGLLFWDRYQGFRRKNYSESLYKMIKRFSPNFCVQDSVKAEIFENFDCPFLLRETSLINTNLSSFYPEVTFNGPGDLPLTVETINLQSYGFISLIYINN